MFRCKGEHETWIHEDKTESIKYKSHKVMKNTNLKWKNMLDGINSRWDISEEKIRQLENTALKPVPIRHKEGKGWEEKYEPASVTCGTMLGKGETEKNMWRKKQLKFFQIWWKLYKVQWTTRRIKINIPKHITTKVAEHQW